MQIRAKGGNHMIDGIVIRGTTPIHEFEIPYPIEIVKNIRITYA
jgi:hypothetical protein